MRRDYRISYKEIQLPFKIKRPVLALGSQTKNTLCFAKGGLAFLSPAHPDLSNPKDFLSFQKAMKCFLKERPQIIACDLHPEYQSSKCAHKLSAIGYRLSAIQHHHAHIGSCMVENNLKNEKVIGVAFDGTGLGTDNTIWGAEFLICDYKNFQRMAHLKEIPLLGGEKAIIEPWRLVVAWFYVIYKDKFLDLDLALIKKINKKKWRILKSMYLSGLNAPLASSMGRLFDAVASLVLVRGKASFEAELAMELERIASGFRLWASGYRFRIVKNKEIYIIDPRQVFKGIIADLRSREPREKIAYSFHLAVAEMTRDVCLLLRKEGKINKVVLSGGVFQNKLLLSLSLGLLYEESFEVFRYKDLSCDDSSISLGQAAVASYMRG